jgi:hypothetical protein
MPPTLKKQIEVLHEQAEELLEVQEDLQVIKQEITVKVLAGLLKKFTEAVDELLEGQAKTYGGKDFDIVVKGIVESAVTEIARAMKMPEMKPVIQVDLTGVAKNIKELQQSSDSRYAALTEKILEAIGKAESNIDYTKQLIAIAEGLNRKRKYVIGNLQRDAFQKTLEGFTITEV